MKREMKRMQGEHRQERARDQTDLKRLSGKLDTLTAACREIDMTMNLRIDNPEVKVFLLAKLKRLIR